MISATSSSAEVLVFRRGHVPKYISEKAAKHDEESSFEKQTHPDSSEKQEKHKDKRSKLHHCRKMFSLGEMSFTISRSKVNLAGYLTMYLDG